MTHPVVEPVINWFEIAERPLAWRAEGVSPWGIFLSEMMSHQTPVARVEPIWLIWMDRWPTPAAMASVPSGEVIRAWGRLGYPRRALRIHEAARVMVERFGGRVPDQVDDLLNLPGVGPYTAAAVASFAFGRRTAVIDVNIRRVLARAVGGEAQPARTTSLVEQRLAEAVLPAEPEAARLWNAAAMELGALICTARSPQCPQCPVLDLCAWVGAGRPAPTAAPAKGQAWAGTDRQVRGRIVQTLREADEPVELRGLSGVPDEQFRRCLASLEADGLIVPNSAGGFQFPG